MDEYSEVLPEDLSFWDKHRFQLLITITITVALLLVGISMALYASSGAAQLDLSRPGYRAVSSQAVDSDSDFENYAPFGQIDQAAIKEFNALYEKQASRAKAVDAFSGDPLNPDVLELSAPSTAQ